MRISDWSSDVCSSDLLRAAADVVLAQIRNGVRVVTAGVAGQRVGEGELVGIVVVFAAGALEPGVVGAESQPVERAAVPVELDRIVLGGGDLAMGALGEIGRAHV